MLDTGTVPVNTKNLLRRHFSVQLYSPRTLLPPPPSSNQAAPLLYLRGLFEHFGGGGLNVDIKVTYTALKNFLFFLNVSSRVSERIF